jgi:AAA domain
MPSRATPSLRSWSRATSTKALVGLKSRCLRLSDRVAELNLCATTVASGKWTDDCVRALAGRDVIILEDNDETGRKKSHEAAVRLHPIARSVRIRRFTDLPEGGDVSDWLDSHPIGTYDALTNYCWSAPLWALHRDSEPVAPEKPADPAPEKTTEPNIDPFGNVADIEPWWREPVDIPQRQFLYKKHYARGDVSATVGGGGRAKTTQALYEALSMAVGHDLETGEVLPDGPLRVWVLNGEEKQDELDRRVAAICHRYSLTKKNLGDRLFLQSVRDKPVRVAKLVKSQPVLIPDAIRYLSSFVAHHAIDVLMVDPLVSFHAVPENDNVAMDVVVKEGFGAIANQANIAREVLHHPGKPKPGQPETAVEDARGASAVIWAVRAARVNNFMTTEEAAKLGITEEERRLHIRIQNGKANTGPVGNAIWIKLVVENLPNGDQVAVATPWTPPNPFDGVSSHDMEAARKLAEGGKYRANSQSKEWFGFALAQQLNLKVTYKGDNNVKDYAKLQGLIKAWLKSGVLAIKTQTNEDHKKKDYIVPGNFAGGQ